MTYSALISNGLIRLSKERALMTAEL